MDKTVFLSITAVEVEDMLAQGIVGREREILAYEINILTYEGLIADGGLSPDFEKQLIDRLVTENREREKSLFYYNAMIKQINPANLAAAVAKAKAKLPV
jgi:hypothetical protein